MSQQMVNGSHYDGSVTITNRMSPRYAVIGEPFKGKHKKPQDSASIAKRRTHWKIRNGTIEDELLEFEAEVLGYRRFGKIVE